VPTNTPVSVVFPPTNTPTPTPVPVVISPQPPTFQQLQDQYFLYVNEPFRLTVQATDANDDALELRATVVETLPGASWNKKFGKQPVSVDLVWTPSQLGDYYVTFSAEDEIGMTAQKTVRFAVINRPPSPTPAPTAINTPTRVPAPTSTPTITPTTTPTGTPTATPTQTPKPLSVTVEALGDIPWEKATANNIVNETAEIRTTNYYSVFVKMSVEKGAGGISGLSAALESAKAGYQVILVEKEAELGGWGAKLYKQIKTEFNKKEVDKIAKIVSKEKANIDANIEASAELLNNK